MILLELTTKEAEFIREVIALEKNSVTNSKLEWAEKERKTGICNSFLAKVDVMITANDLFLLISQAKREYLSLNSGLHISGIEVDKKDLPHISVTNALLLFLNGENLLKKMVRFDITDQSGQYEELEE